MPGPALPDPNVDEPDEALMLRYAAGDIAAFDTLYARRELGVWRFLLRSVRIAAVADDLLQDVWFAVARQGGSLRASTDGGTGYQPSARFKTWLFTIAHHRLIDHFRSDRHDLRLDDDAKEDGTLLDTLAADSGLGPLRQLQSRQQAEALIEAVEQLPAEQREAFLLQAEGGLSVEDIARATGVNFETAKSRLRYARQRLRQQLQEFA
ncbi:RNA polymerase subunit sigma-24 [Rhodoferax koreense]|uniref:RNA polymerase subunit sigma-24 n=1 Tax=Rhodoferax koreensis TaxID=1842727 RepID=A0A1P8K333_9BURK|nr:sigma-70 family RNA polymerase sigma factor [Rhodoferax koreense]APW40406.1 RNA polymerase subunit sigma-24 [Rhodoferax koreense]